jgi:alpha-L-fucosidase
MKPTRTLAKALLPASHIALHPNRLKAELWRNAFLPLPKGEGRGEGEETVLRPTALKPSRTSRPGQVIRQSRGFSKKPMNPISRLAKRLFPASCLGLLLTASLPSVAAPAPESTPPANAARLQWWRAARFGMFIHWGPVSLKGTEIGWSRGAQIPIGEYDNLYRQFNPTNFNADEWVATARNAGMKYVVFTTKHHDGFCMWGTQQTDFNVTRSPFARDVVKELAAACRRQGLEFGTYHSVCDWHHPDFPLTSPGGSVRRAAPNLDRYEAYLRAEVKELITGYGPLLLMWFDVPQEFDPRRGLALEEFTRGLQPDIIINDRSGARGDYDTPEQRVGNYQDSRPWETCMTICQQWAWKPNDAMKSLRECLQNLVLCAGGDGNLLFNVGPMPDGRIEPRQVERLREMGAWLAKYGETVYGTRGGPFKPTRAYASTRQDKTIFLHVFRWDGEGVTLPDLPRKVTAATVLSGGQAEVTRQDGRLIIRVPTAARQEVDTVVRLDLDESAMSLSPVSPTTTVKATASNVFQNQQDHYGPEMAFDNDPGTRWATDAGTKRAWIAADLGRPMRIQRVKIDEAYPGRVKKFEFQHHDGGEWKTLFSGTSLGQEFQHSFDPVTTREIRLNILEASEGPTLTEIEVLEK